jgi:hypothetical protein
MSDLAVEEDTSHCSLSFSPRDTGFYYLLSSDSFLLALSVISSLVSIDDRDLEIPHMLIS